MASFRRLLKMMTCGAGVVLLSACGFHLRQSAALPVPMQQQVYLNVTGGGELPRELARALNVREVQVVDQAAPGVAELDVAAQFRTDVLTSTGFARVGEYAVRYHVDLSLKDGSGTVVLPQQGIDLSHEFTFDPFQAIGTAAQTEVIERDLTREMTDAIMRRLEAAGRKGTLIPPGNENESTSIPAGASSLPAPASTSLPASASSG
ncbi:MAG TPA: LPS assembly lipoprotein LptE [Rhodanobacteraceae bacterium]|nr:LPS assembly lipoprotein LptE [Rhodanobacteraceae bacterium]